MSKKDTIIVSFYSYLDSTRMIEIEHQKILLDTLHMITEVTEDNKKNTLDYFDFNSQSIRKFSFNNKLYYCLQITEKGGFLTNIIYDVCNKNIQGFKTFREPVYYYVGNVNGDRNLNFLFIENGLLSNGDGLNHFRISIFTLINGEWRLLKNKKGKKYFIEGTTPEKNDRWIVEGDSGFRIKNYYWPNKIDLKDFQ